MNASEFLQNASLNALLVAFANAKPCENGYLIEAFYKNSKYAPYELDTAIYQQNNLLLQRYTGLDFELVGTKHHFYIQSSETKEVFFQNLYHRIIQKRFEDQYLSDDEFEKMVLLSFFALRGSPDFRLNFYSLDWLRDVVHDQYLDNIFKLLTNLPDLRQLNLNFRELQGQFITGKNQRNTQFRVNLRYFYDKVGVDLAQVNRFKFDSLKHNKHLILDRNIAQSDDPKFIERLQFYTNKVFNQNKTNQEIEKLRKELGFEYDLTIDDKAKRNLGIVQYVRVFFPDECAACRQQYAIADRTFKYRNSERYYLEIHHCISFSADKTCDQIDNLVKLCPVCHRALTKNRADEHYQKQLIQNIFNNAPQAYEFCLNFADKNQVLDFVYERLR